MFDDLVHWEPEASPRIREATQALGFNMASDPQTGALLRTLAASKPDGRLLELGTGTGAGTAWLLAGMTRGALLDSVESDPAALVVAIRHLGTDLRVRFHEQDAAEFLVQAVAPGKKYDLIFADTWPGKFNHLEQALSLLAPGGIYLIDDLLPQPNWPEGHAEKIAPLVAALESAPSLCVTRLCWATGILIATKKP